MTEPAVELPDAGSKDALPTAARLTQMTVGGGNYMLCFEHCLSLSPGICIL